MLVFLLGSLLTMISIRRTNCFRFPYSYPQHGVPPNIAPCILLFLSMMCLLSFEFLTTLYAYLSLTIEDTSVCVCIIFHAIYNLFENSKFSKTKTWVSGFLEVLPHLFISYLCIRCTKNYACFFFFFAFLLIVGMGNRFHFAMLKVWWSISALSFTLLYWQTYWWNLLL